MIYKVVIRSNLNWNSLIKIIFAFAVVYNWLLHITMLKEKKNVI